MEMGDGMLRKCVKVGLGVCVGFILVVMVGFAYLRRLPPPDIALNTMVTFYDVNGYVFLEEMVPNRRRFVTLDEISPYVIDGFIATEDRNFWEHEGFYYPSILRSVIANIRAGDSVQGGSTITQQYARNLMVSFEQTIQRKLREAAYTVRLESSYEKEEILEGYLNTINFGHGVYGIEDAAQFYFGVHASELSLAQASILVGIPKGPSIYSPIDNYDNARGRQRIVLNAMLDVGTITEEEKEVALQTELTFIGRRPVDDWVNYYFVDAVLREVEELLIEDGGMSRFEHLHVHTTLDPLIQSAVNDAVVTHIADTSDLQSVVIVMEPGTGNVLALSGGRDYGTSQFNRAIHSERQVGSIMKPILYIAALEYGFTPSTAFISRPTTFVYNNGNNSYTPNNYSNRYAFEEISMANALAISDNIFAVKTHDFLGMDVLPAMAHRLGITAEIDEIPSAALGVTNISMMEMTEAYGIFANEGRDVEHRFVTLIKEDDEVIVDNRRVNVGSEQVVSATHTFILNEMMTGMFNLAHNNHLGITGLSILPQTTHRYAGKTGSTDTDSWMIGYTADLVTTVWVGYDENVKIGSDTVLAKLIWVDVMEESLRGGSRWFNEPGDVIAIPVDARSGIPVSANSPRKINLYFERENLPH